MGNKVKTIATQSKISLRLKRIKDGKWTFFIDDNSKSKRTQKSIGIYLDGDKVSDAVRKQNALIVFNTYCNTAFADANNIWNNKALITLVEYYIKFIDNISYKEHYRNSLKHIVNFFGSKKHIQDVTEQDVELYIVYLQSKLKDATVISYRGFLVRVLRQAYKDKLVPILIQPKSVKNRNKYNKKYLTVPEVKKLLEVMNRDNPYELAFMFCVFTGLRISDVQNLKWESIRNNSLIITQKKGNKQNVIPLSEMAMSLLPDKSSDKVFGYMSRDIVKQKLLAFTQRAGLNVTITFHASRHTFATMLINQNVNALTVKELLGHSTLDMTMIYAQIDDNQKKYAVKTLDDLYE